MAPIWLAARRLNQGKFDWPGIRHGSEVELDNEQLQALVLGLVSLVNCGLDLAIDELVDADFIKRFRQRQRQATKA